MVGASADGVPGIFGGLRHSMTEAATAKPNDDPEHVTMHQAATDTNAAAFDSVHDDVFTRIASRYDLLCDLFSLGIHRTWKQRMARRIASERWERMLDVAAGTGDIALRVVRNLGG